MSDPFCYYCSGTHPIEQNCVSYFKGEKVISQGTESEKQLPLFTGTKATPTGGGSLTGAISRVTTTNPKDLIGELKVSLSAIPPIALVHEARAMMDGAKKYGPYNWRDKEIQARIYIDAALRHIYSWFEGEEYSQDAKVHHLGHARACLGILLDAMESGNLIDNRPSNSQAREVFVREVGRVS